MIRMLICAIACHLMLTTAVCAQENPLKSIWPFGKDRAKTTRSFDNINPFKTTTTPVVQEEKKFTLPSPTKLIDRAEARTGAMFQRTRETWRGVQEFGRNLNPFAVASKPTRKKGPSFIDRLLPKKKVESPSTVGEFINMKRPSM